ncbi:MAG: amino acid decarboxylase [Chloroflexi bacterium]|nr:amino acid decarboxylase [Chloroflexota bacterium]
MSDSYQGELDLQEFRQTGHQLVEWIAEYLAHPEQYPVLSRSQPGEIKAQLPTAVPEQPDPLAAIITDFEQIILPGITHWNHPSFHAYFSTTGSAPGILAEMLIAALNVNGMLWRTSPAATELEEVTLNWLRQLLGLPADFAGVIMDGASMSSMIAVAIAREAVAGLDVRRQGLVGRSDTPRLRAYISDQTHSSVEKGAIVLGIGQENVIKIASDEQFRMDAAALETAVLQDLSAGYRPFFVCASVGTTSTTSIDPVPAIADIAEKYGLWLHVDGAYGGVAAIIPEQRHLLDGVARADSFVTNPHKWLFTPMDLSAFYTRHPDILRRAFSLLPEYLRNAETEANAVIDYMDYGVQLGRRFRSLKLWFVLRAYGQEGLIARLREHIRLAAMLAGWIDAAPDFERLAPTPLSTVCFRAHPRRLDNPEQLNMLNERLLTAVNKTGQIFLSHTKLKGAYTLRLAIGNIRTEESHIQYAWELLQEKLREM